MDDLTSSERDILVILSTATEMKGCEVKEQLSAYHNKEPTNGIYAVLTRLGDKGLVTFEKQGTSKLYSLTPRGVGAVEEQINWFRKNIEQSEYFSIVDSDEDLDRKREVKV
jgi:DNA-binding PadR family transcriptional regulator